MLQRWVGFTRFPIKYEFYIKESIHHPSSHELSSRNSGANLTPAQRY